KAAADDTITLQSGHSTIIEVDGMSRVAVGDGRIAGVVPIGTSQLIVNGKEPGKTSLFVWSGSRRLTYRVTVTNQMLDDLAPVVRAAISEPGVQVVSFGRTVVVRGTVPDEAHFVQLNDVVSRFSDMAKQEKYNLVNAVTVTRSLESLQQLFSNKAEFQDLQIEPDGKGNVIVSGTVQNGTEAQQVLEQAKEFAGPYLAADGKLVDRLRRVHATEIDIKVYVLEVDRTGLSDLGLQLQSGTPDPNNPNHIILGPPSFPVLEAPSPANIPGRALNVGQFYRTTILAPTLNLLLQSGHARILSSPDLVSLPGTKATFLVGGQIPYVYSTGLGAVSVEFKKYGVQLNVTPTLLGNGQVDSVINPDISDLDYANAVILNGFLIPALKESTLETELVTKPGESILMGGLLRRQEEKTIQKVPLLGDIPILGQLFRSTNYQRNDSDVVFVMTPEVLNQ
ncbi:MAG: pilus assembly protein N-terminal domain-containing protein, partial [Candidatus Eremiobacteraeota bacterium]|nr:pilus assembly protein N-terminal domain-containing protein [Candidatus Eremiobacteraeota bacterium]